MPSTPFYIIGLANCLVEQGRYVEAEKLIRVALEINRAVGVTNDSQIVVNEMSFLASILNLQYKRKEAAELYAEIDKAMANWDPQRRQQFDLNGSRIYALYAAGQIERGIAAAEALVKRNTTRYGEKFYDTALARGTLAVGYMRAKRDADAAREFRTAIPLLMAAAQESSKTIMQRRQRRAANVCRMIVEAYIGLLDRGARTKTTTTSPLNRSLCPMPSAGVRAAGNSAIKRSHADQG